MNIITDDLRGNFVSKHFLSVIESYVPRKIKRLFYLSTLYAKMLNTTKPKEDQLARLNEQLKLEQVVDAIRVSCSLHKCIWRKARLDVIPIMDRVLNIGELDKTNLSDDEYWAISHYVSEQCPKWLRYGSKSMMISDLHDLMTQCFGLKTGALH